MKAAVSGWPLRAFLLVAGLAAVTCGTHRVDAHDAQGNPTVLRDTEIEADIRTLEREIVGMLREEAG